MSLFVFSVLFDKFIPPVLTRFRGSTYNIGEGVHVFLVTFTARETLAALEQRVQRDFSVSKGWQLKIGSTLNRSLLFDRHSSSQPVYDAKPICCEPVDNIIHAKSLNGEKLRFQKDHVFNQGFRALVKIVRK